MNDDTTISPLHQPGSILDPLTEIAREGARQMLAAALKAEAASFVARFADERLSDGRQRVVHHGTGPERTIQTGIGPLAVKRHKVRDRAADVGPRRESASPRTSCRGGRGAPAVSMRCCRCFTCVACPWATSKRR